MTLPMKKAPLEAPQSYTAVTLIYDGNAFSTFKTLDLFGDFFYSLFSFAEPSQLRGTEGMIFLMFINSSAH